MKLLNLIFKTSTDGILSTFTKTISKLETHAAAQYDRAVKLQVEADKKMQKSKDATLEADKASIAASKIATFFKAE
jgi:hypothetical protein